MKIYAKLLLSFGISSISLILVVVISLFRLNDRTQDLNNYYNATLNKTAELQAIYAESLALQKSEFWLSRGSDCLLSLYCLAGPQNHRFSH